MIGGLPHTPPSQGSHIFASTGRHGNRVQNRKYTQNVKERKVMGTFRVKLKVIEALIILSSNGRMLACLHPIYSYAMMTFNPQWVSHPLPA